MDTGNHVRQYMKNQGKKFPDAPVQNPSKSNDATEAMAAIFLSFKYLVAAMDKDSTETVLVSLANLRWHVEELELALGTKTAKQNEIWNALKGIKNEPV